MQGGAVVYAMRIPERWWPGAFDFAFNSHQLFHMAVIIAASVHYRGTRILLDWRDSTGSCSVEPLLSYLCDFDIASAYNQSFHATTPALLC